MNGVRLTVALCMLFIALVVGAFVFSVTRDRTLSFEELQQQGSVMLPRPRALAGIEMQTTDGEDFNEASLEGGWTFAYFGFTNCPDICPTTMSVMGQAYNELSAEERPSYRGLLVTVDPERDDAQKLASYAQAFSPSFQGVRGSIAQTAAFATQVNVAFQKLPGVGDEPYQMDHSGNLVIINPKGHYHGFIKLPHTRDKLVNTFRTLQASF